MAKKKLSVEEMQAYIAERMDLISEKKRAAFDAMDLEEQYKKIKSQEAARKFAEKKKDGFVAAKISMVERVRSMFETYGVSFDELDEVVEFVTNYKTELKEKMLRDLDDKIAELSAKRAELEK